MLASPSVLIIGLGSLFSSGHGFDFATVSASGDSSLGNRLIRREEQQSGTSVKSDLSGPAKGRVVVDAVGNATGASSGVNTNQSVGKGAEAKKFAKLADRDRNTAAALSNGLFKTLAAVTVVFYCVKCEKAVLRIGTWKVLNGCLSLIITVLLFTAKKNAWLAMFSMDTADADALVLADVFSSARFLCVAMLILSLLKRFSGQPMKLAFVRTMGTHIIGFWGCDAFTDMLKQHAFSRNSSYCLLGVFTIISILELVFGLTAMLRFQAGVSTDADRESGPIQSYLEACEQMEVEISGFVSGFLFSLWFRFAIIGSMPGSQYVRNITQEDVNRLRIVVLLNLLVWLAMEKFLPRLIQAHRFNTPEAGAVTHRFARKLTETSAMTTSWLLFYVLQWGFYVRSVQIGDGSHLVVELAASNSLAVLSSFLIFVAMFALAFAGPLGACVLVSSRFVNWAVLLVGFCWETAVYMVVQGACSTLEETEKHATSFIMICCIIVALVPAWLMYVLPASLEEFDPLAVSPGVESQEPQQGQGQDQKPEVVPTQSKLLHCR